VLAVTGVESSTLQQYHSLSEALYESCVGLANSCMSFERFVVVKRIYLSIYSMDLKDHWLLVAVELHIEEQNNNNIFAGIYYIDTIYVGISFYSAGVISE